MAGLIELKDGSTAVEGILRRERHALNKLDEVHRVI